jgi:hypothetical protein
VTPISAATNKVGRAIKVGNYPFDIAITPDGKTAYVATSSGVTPINTATNTADKAIKVESGVIAITPNGKTVYVYNDVAGTLTPISTATNKAGKVIKVGTPMKYDVPPPPHRDHPEREDRLRHQRLGVPDPDRDQHGRQAHRDRQRRRRHCDHAVTNRPAGAGPSRGRPGRTGRESWP